MNADRRNFYKVEKWTKDGAKIITCSMPAAKGIDTRTLQAYPWPSLHPLDHALCRASSGSVLKHLRQGVVFAVDEPPNAPACGNPNQVQSGICLSLI